MKKSKIAQIVNKEYFKQYSNDSIFCKAIDTLTLSHEEPTEDMVIKIISDICELYSDQVEEYMERLLRNE